MRRRNFIITLMASIGILEKLSLKKALALDTKTASTTITKKPEPFKIEETQESSFTLKGGSEVILPENPVPFQSMIRFRVQTMKWSKSPIIYANNHNVMGEKKNIVVKKDVNLNVSKDFLLQYMGPDIGWNIIS